MKVFDKHSPYLLEEQLFNAIKVGDEVLAINFFNEINKNERAILSINPLQSIKNSVICSITIFTRAAIESKIDDETAFSISDKYINLVDQATSYNEVINYELDALKSYISLISTFQKTIYSDIIISSLKYINSNLKSKLSLHIIANAIPCSASYLSQKFNQEIGIPITKFINKRKIKESLYYLRQNYSIYQIVKEYHFSSESYYISLFKQIYKLTPKAYLNYLNNLHK